MNLHLYAIVLLTAKERFIIQMVQCSRTLVDKEERDDVLLVV